MPVVELSDVAVFVPIDAIWPELRSDEATLLGLLASLSRDDTLFWCARVNTIVTPWDTGYQGAAAKSPQSSSNLRRD
jgi:hypothetical protein